MRNLETDARGLARCLAHVLHGWHVVLAEDLVPALAQCCNCDDQPRPVRELLLLDVDARRGQVLLREVVLQLQSQDPAAGRAGAAPVDDVGLLEGPESALPDVEQLLQVGPAAFERRKQVICPRHELVQHGHACYVDLVQRDHL